MLVKAVKSKIITAKDDLLNVVLLSVKKRGFREGDILVITSKVLAVTQNKTIHVLTSKDFMSLIEKEADQIIGGEQVTLTLKNGILIPWAGIDRSNTPLGTAIPWPDQPFKAAQILRNQIIKKFKIKQFGVLITDSHCVPLRKGVNGIALGYAGFQGVQDLRGKNDLYENKLKVTQQNIADMLASSAHLVMGESDECTPFAIITGAPVNFTNKTIKIDEPLMPARDCLYAPIYNKKILKN